MYAFLGRDATTLANHRVAQSTPCVLSDWRIGAMCYMHLVTRFDEMRTVHEQGNQ
jgi:hypothetical protein